MRDYEYEDVLMVFLKDREHPSSSKLFAAKVGAVSDFSVYWGYVNSTDELDDVLRFGDKLGESNARQLFPQLSQLRYRP